MPEPHAGLAPARTALCALAAEDPRLLLEDKGLSVALHYRSAPQLAKHVLATAGHLARQLGLTLQTGKMVAELRTPGADKGDALRAFMSEPPFAGHVPIFIGDDDTDEAAFRAAAALGGHGIRVGRPNGPTAAAWHLADVSAVAIWLEGC